ncbi:9988_t:CDS:2 [Cetraspora pellucida]|uniref:9988_t:CDS:1 n=1 Tax=Cetraspora pellucida TaxID=1433469 RepID=A0A9N9N8V4_9GLOM|nr:9988_t:CDS:2 [Cetraspora pellucida]
MTTEEAPKDLSTSDAELCNKTILNFRFEAFTILCCGHLLHRICLETYILQGGELGLASGECFLASKSYDKGKASQESNKTIDDDRGELEIMRNMGLVEEDSISAKQASKEDQTIIPIVDNSVSMQEQVISPISNEKGTMNLVQVNLTNQDNTNETTDSTTSLLKRPNLLASDNLQSTKKVKKSDEKKKSNVVKKLIEELSTKTSQILEVSEESTGNFHDLYLAINKTEDQSEYVNRLVVKSYYDLGKALKNRYDHYKKSNPKHTAQALVNKEVMQQLPSSVSETLL